MVRNAEWGWVAALGSITVGAMKIIVSDNSFVMASVPPMSGVIGAKVPVVPGMPVVVVPSVLRVRPANTTTSAGADQKLVSIKSVVSSVSRCTDARLSANLVSSSRVVRRLYKKFLRPCEGLHNSRPCRTPNACKGQVIKIKIAANSVWHLVCLC